MARAIRHDDWPARLTDDQIISRVGHGAFQRGLDYARKGRVWGIGVAGDGDIISAQSKGSGARTYQTMVFRKQNGRAPAAWAGSCSCPVGTNCKHVAALLITARALAEREPDAAAPAERVSAWEGQLAGLLQVERTPRRRMALEIIDDPGSMWDTPAGPSMLPLIEGKRGWNRQGASWSQIATGRLDDEVDPTVMGVLRELAGMADGYGFYYADDRVSLVTAPARVWDVLRRGVAAGLTLTTAQRHGQPVYLAEGLRGGVEPVLRQGARRDEQGCRVLAVAAHRARAGAGPGCRGAAGALLAEDHGLVGVRARALGLGADDVPVPGDTDAPHPPLARVVQAALKGPVADPTDDLVISELHRPVVMPNRASHDPRLNAGYDSFGRRPATDRTLGANDTGLAPGHVGLGAGRGERPTVARSDGWVETSPVRRSRVGPGSRTPGGSHSDDGALYWIHERDADL